MALIKFIIKGRKPFFIAQKEENFMFDNLFTWEFIASFIGMVATVSLLTQLTKNMFDQLFGKIKTEKLVYIFSLIVVGVIVATTANFNVPAKEVVQNLFTAFINAILVAFASMKSYENILSQIPIWFGGKDEK